MYAFLFECKYYNIQRKYAQRAQTSTEHGMTQLVSNTEDPDFGLWTPGSEA